MNNSNDDKAQADVGLSGEVPYRPDPLNAAKLATLTAMGAMADHLRAAQKVSFQARVNLWMLDCFGAEVAADIKERPHRFLEEALELVQSVGTLGSEARQLVDYVFSRPAGDQHQEVGGVMVTLASLCSTIGVNMMIAGEAELGRVNTPDMIAKLRAKNAAKDPGSPLPGFAAAPFNAERQERAAPIGYVWKLKDGPWRFEDPFFVWPEKVRLESKDFDHIPLYAAIPTPAAVQEPVAVKAMLEDIALPVVATLFVARGGATARAVPGVESGASEYSDLVRMADVVKALEPIRSALSQSDPAPETAALRAALAPLVSIADAYDDNDLDGDARKRWGSADQFINTSRPETIELYSGRGGKRLLTLADCFAARAALKSEG